MTKQHSDNDALQQDDLAIGKGATPGSYLLLLHCETAQWVEVGKLGRLEVRPGWYLYAGSAFGPGGVRARCRRHWLGGRPHWHMDYLRPHCRLAAIWYSHDSRNQEHRWTKLLSAYRGAQLPFAGFGASDCDCESHLIRMTRCPSLRGFRRRVRQALPDHAPILELTLPST